MRASSRPCARPRSRVPALLLVGCALAFAPAPAALGQTLKGDYHEDARFGFKVKPPKEWKAIPVPSGQSWVIGKYLSEKKYFYTEKGSYTYEFQPEMVIVAFVSDELKKAARKKALEEAKDKEAKEQIEEAIERAQESDFRDYKDYLTKTYSGGGFYFSAEEPGDHDGMRTMAYEAKVEKGTSGGPKRILARVYSLPDVDIAVQMEILDQDYDKLASVLEGAFRSLKQIPREGEMPLMQGHASGYSFVSFSELEEMTVAERAAKRREQEQEAHEKVIAGLADGWHHAKLDGFLIVSCADDRFDKKVAEQAGAVFAWLDKTFPYVGQGEYVREPIIRVCRTYDEEQAYLSHASASGIAGLEVSTNQEYGGTRSYESGYINSRMVEIWFNDRDRKLWWGMPAWIRTGIAQVVIEATAKNGKLDFYRGDWTAATLRELVSEDRVIQPRDLIYLPRSDFFGDDGNENIERIRQAQALVDYLLLGPGAKSAKTKDLIKDYIANVKAVIAEMEAADEAEEDEGEDDKPKTEEEEEAALREQKELWKARERQLINEAGRRTFSGWDEGDWADLARNYSKTL